MLPRYENSVSADGDSTWSCKAAAHMSHRTIIIIVLTDIMTWYIAIITQLVIFLPKVPSNKLKE